MIAITTRRKNGNRQRSAAPRAARQHPADAKRSKIRYAVVGLGYISQVAVLPAFKHARKNSILAALVSGDPKKRKILSRKYGVEHAVSYDDYDDLLNSGEIDAVYIALPNSMHADFSIRAADAGVHVLCEKPMAVTEDECQQMIDAAHRNNVKLMIAYRLHFEAANLNAMQLAQSGKLGALRLFNSTFSMNVKDSDNIRLKRDLGGGTLYDIGIYCINAARYIFRAAPVEVTAFSSSSDDPRFTSVDEMTSAIMRFPDSRLATFITCFSGASVATYEVVGSKGSLFMEHAYEYSEPIKQYVTINQRTRQRTYPKRDQFAPELLYFSHCILNDLEPEPSGEQGLIDVRIIEALYRSAQSGQPVSLSGFPRTRHPAPEQEIKRPPISEPRLVGAESPSGE